MKDLKFKQYRKKRILPKYRVTHSLDNKIEIEFLGEISTKIKIKLSKKFMEAIEEESYTYEIIK